MKSLFQINKNISVLKLASGDYLKLKEYLSSLSDISKSRFQPHAYDLKDINQYYKNHNETLAYIALDESTKEIIAYFLFRNVFYSYEKERFNTYGIQLSQNDVFFAPSVKDNWQGLGIGSHLFSFCINDLKDLNKKRLFLWAGVQEINKIAISFYKKNNFKILGSFEYKGTNIDMQFLLI